MRFWALPISDAYALHAHEARQGDRLKHAIGPRVGNHEAPARKVQQYLARLCGRDACRRPRPDGRDTGDRTLLRLYLVHPLQLGNAARDEPWQIRAQGGDILWRLTEHLEHVGGHTW